MLRLSKRQRQSIGHGQSRRTSRARRSGLGCIRPHPGRLCETAWNQRTHVARVAPSAFRAAAGRHGRHPSRLRRGAQGVYPERDRPASRHPRPAAARQTAAAIGATGSLCINRRRTLRRLRRRPAGPASGGSDGETPRGSAGRIRGRFAGPAPRGSGGSCARHHRRCGRLGATLVGGRWPSEERKLLLGFVMLSAPPHLLPKGRRCPGCEAFFSRGLHRTQSLPASVEAPRRVAPSHTRDACRPKQKFRPSCRDGSVAVKLLSSLFARNGRPSLG